jgi:hypothetical protein
LEDAIMRTIAIVIACFLAVAGPAFGETGGLDRENGRYSFKDIPDGLLRLDTRTGHVSLCNKRSTGWACQAVPDDRTALEDEIARIESENAILKKALLSRGLPLPDGVKAPRALGPEPELKFPSDAELDRVMSFFEKMWRRLVDMVQRMQKEIDGKDAEKL